MHITQLTKSLLPLAAFTLSCHLVMGQGETLKDDLVSYWPLDEIQGDKTPDLASGFDFLARNVDADDLIEGKFGMAINFKKVNKAHLFRSHDPADDLPAIKNDSFTIAYWVRLDATGQSDLRTFCEGSSLPNDGTPLLTMGTVPGGSSGSLDVFIRDKNGFPTVNHTPTSATPLDGLDWHHVAFVQTAQPDTSATREVYIDGVLDGIVIDPKPAGYTHNMNNTAIAAVVRTGDVAHVDGDIDEVVIWKRALLPAEITDLIENGMPDLEEQQEELQIRRFGPEFLTVVAGDEVKISWDATKDATIVIDQGVGDVTDASEFGVGSAMVMIDEETTFTLTATRDGDDPVTSTLTVTPITGVSAGWNWIEDFNDLTLGGLSDQGSWLTAQGQWDITTIGDTQALITTGGNDLTGRTTETHAIQEDSSRTLFFRFCYSAEEADFPVNAKVGISEKAIRFTGDYAENIGTYVIFSRFPGEELQLQAVNGIDGLAEDSGIIFMPDTSYDVWIDVKNVPLTETDTFSVHVAPTGGTRETVFEDFSSDREPQEINLLGFPRPIIDTVFLVTNTAQDESTRTLAFDDFYISDADGFNSTAPVAPGFGKVLPADLVITDFSFDTETQELSLTWDSQANTNYKIMASADLSEDSWNELQDGVASEGASTSETFTVDLGGAFEKYFFRVEVEQ